MSETPSSPTKVGEANKLAAPTNISPGKKFEGEGLPFKAKLIGTEDLPVDRDEKACLDSMFKLKAVAHARGDNKQKIQLNVTMDSVKIIDEISKKQIASHEVERISFVVIDPRDARAFGYIYNTPEERHQFWAIKTERAAAITVLALKELFEIAFEEFSKVQNPKNVNQPSVTTTPPAPGSPPAETLTVQQTPGNVPTNTVQSPSTTPQLPPQTITEPTKPTVPEPAAAAKQPPLIDNDLWGESNTKPVAAANQPPNNANLFDFNEQLPAPIQTPQQQNSNAPSSFVDLFGDLSAMSITQPQQQQQQPQQQPPVAAAPPPPAATSTSNQLFGLFSNPNPTPTVPQTTVPYAGYYPPQAQPPVQQNFMPAYGQFQPPMGIQPVPPVQSQPPLGIQPMSFAQPQPPLGIQQMSFAQPQPPLGIQTPPNLVATSPLSPVAHPPVQTQFAGLSGFDLLSSASTAPKSGKDMFFPMNAPKSMQQMQMEKQS